MCGLFIVSIYHYCNTICETKQNKNSKSAKNLQGPIKVAHTPETQYNLVIDKNDVRINQSTEVLVKPREVTPQDMMKVEASSDMHIN